MTYSAFYRHIDGHGVLHLATGAMLPSEALCGMPPVGNHGSDLMGSIYPPYALTGPYKRVCDVCNEKAGS